MDLLVNAVVADNARRLIGDDNGLEEQEGANKTPAYLRAMNVIENTRFNTKVPCAQNDNATAVNNLNIGIRITLNTT